MRLISAPAPIQVTGGAKRFRRGVVAWILLPFVILLWILKQIFLGIIAIIKFVVAYRKEARLGR